MTLSALFAIITAFGAHAQAKPAGEALFERLSPLVFQIKTAVDVDAPKSSYGSGFVIAKAGLLATNYHVVAGAIHERDKYKVYVVLKDKSVEARVVNVDVVHDVALVKIDHEFAAELELADLSHQPGVGEKIYSLGIPQDLNLSIVDGLYNGTLKYAAYEQAQMSVPINPGMSGGPTIDGNGRVIGVNVAILRGSQNLTFAVPVKWLHGLIAETREKSIEGASLADTDKRLEQQLLRAQEEMIADWKSVGSEPAEFPGWAARKAPASLKCWQSKDSTATNKEKEKRFETTSQNCRLPHTAHVTSSLYIGAYSVNYIVLSNKSLNRIQFAAATANTYNKDRVRETSNDEREHTKFKCDERIVANGNGVLLKMNYCLRGYLKYGELFEARVKMATIKKGKEQALVASLSLDGFTLPNILSLVQDVAEGVREK